MEITASLVKELRERTGAGMMDAKKALIEVKGDMEKAADWLRSKGLAAAAKKAGRVAAEGLVAVESAGHHAAVVEVNSETDFVARNDAFQAFARAAAQRLERALQLVDSPPGDRDAAAPTPDPTSCARQQLRLSIAVKKRSSLLWPAGFER